MLDVDLPKMRGTAEKKLVFFYDIVPRITPGVHRLMDNIKEGFDDVYVVGIGKHLHVSDFEVKKNAEKSVNRNIASRTRHLAGRQILRVKLTTRVLVVRFKAIF